MIKINPCSINDLVALKEANVPVTLTSHPGNASLYKLVFWSAGIPEHLWDVTCCKADANNWPMHQLINGQANLLVSKELLEKITRETFADNRFVVAYQFTTNGMRLARFHVKKMQECFPDVISSCSRLLLSEKEKVYEMFDYLARTKKDEVFTRFITTDGMMRPISRSGIKTENLASSFIGLLQELEQLLFSDQKMETKGGACYDGVMVPLSVMLVQYWQTGRADRYDISGPDMIHYALRPEYQKKLSDMINHLRKWNPDLVPKDILVQMFPGTFARVGYLKDHASEEVLSRKKHMLECAHFMDRARKKQFWEAAKNDENLWPIQIKPSTEPYFSQHDLVALQKKLIVDDFWKNIPIAEIRDTLCRANNFLRL